MQKVQKLRREQVRIAELEQQASLLMGKIDELILTNIDQGKTIISLEEKISLLEKELSLYRAKKNSSNSSIPPSQDPYRIKQTESLREKTGRKPGGQPGHEGHCLEMVLNPTEKEIVEHQPNYCQCCGKDLSNVPPEFIGKREVIDIPPIQPTIKEHRIYGKRCCCGHITQSKYPVEAHSPICYGANIQALTAYFHARQYIPYERMTEMYSDVFGLQISSGNLVNMIDSFANKANGIYETIRQRIAFSPVLGGDESGVCINGKNAWAWVFQTPYATFIHCDKSRGKAVINKLFPQGLPFAIAVHDCWKSYFGINVQGHQICTAHLLRELKYYSKLYPLQQWSTDFTSLLHQALNLKKNLLPKDYLQPILKRSELEKQLESLIEQTIDVKHEKLVTFKKRIIEYKNYLFTFLYHPQVPPDNNASERAVRTFKVKQKVSGLFRSDEGAQNFAIIRSVIDTTIKNSKNVMEALVLIPLIQKE